MALSSADIKRELLEQSDISGIRKRAEGRAVDKDHENIIIEQADALEALTHEKGWAYLEAYMMSKVMNNLLKNEDKELAPGMINTMHFIDQMIRARNQIIERRKAESGAS